MTFTSTTDAAAALDAIRSQRAAAEAALGQLEHLQQLMPRGECVVGWSGAASDAFRTDLDELRARLGAVRAAVAGAIDDLWVVIGQADGG